MGPLLSKFNSHTIFQDYYKSQKHPSQKAAFLPGLFLCSPWKNLEAWEPGLKL